MGAVRAMLVGFDMAADGIMRLGQDPGSGSLCQAGDQLSVQRLARGKDGGVADRPAET
jgi:hypothetical protein